VRWFASLGPHWRFSGIIRRDLAVFAVALGLRLAYFLEMRGRPVFETLRLDPLYYWRWALKLFEGDWIGREVFEQSPLYPYLLAALFKAWGSPSVDLARITGALVGALTCVGIARLGERLRPGPGGWIAGLMAAFYGPFIFYDLMVMKTFLAAALTVWATLALARSQGRREGLLFLSGVCLGLAAMVRENLVLVLPCALAWIAVRGKGLARARRIAALGAYLVGVAAVTAPATLRNHWVSGEWVWITSGAGEVFYIGNHAQANGEYFAPPFVRPDPEHEHEDFRAEAARRLGRSLRRSEASAYWLGEGLGYIRTHPLEWLALEARKALIFLNAYELPDNYNYQVLRRLSRVLGTLTFGFGALGPLALVGLGLARRQVSEAAPLWITLGAAFASTLLFFNFGRFRIPAAALLVPFAALALTEIWMRLRQRRWRALATGIVAPWAACLLLVNLSWLGEGTFTQAQDHLALAEAYHEEGKALLAEGEYREALWLVAPGSAHPAVGRLRSAALVALSRLARERGDSEVALEHLSRALAEAPDAPQRAAILEERAEIFWSRGQSAAALKDLQEARSRDPLRFRAAFTLAEYLRRLGRPGEAEALLREAGARVPPEDRLALTNLHFALGRLLLVDLGRPGEARLHLLQVLELSPAFPHAAEVRRLIEQAERLVDRPRTDK
jgi:4-amino-4-deoxy-L-arabinose transferase-like glycosyltransferase